MCFIVLSLAIVGLKVKCALPIAIFPTLFLYVIFLRDMIL